MNYVYLLRCRDGTFYCGWTNHLKARIAAHNSGNGAKYTRSRLPVELVYCEEYDSRHEAMSREWHIKRMSRQEKADLACQSAGTMVKNESKRSDEANDCISLGKMR